LETKKEAVIGREGRPESGPSVREDLPELSFVQEDLAELHVRQKGVFFEKMAARRK
jgi:hypothetical protein